MRPRPRRSRRRLPARRTDSACDCETSKAQSAVKNQYLSISPGHPDSGMLPPPMRVAHAPAFVPHSEQLLNWSDLHGSSTARKKHEPPRLNARSRALSGLTSVSDGSTSTLDRQLPGA